MKRFQFPLVDPQASSPEFTHYGSFCHDSNKRIKICITLLLDDRFVDMAFITGLADKWFSRLISEARFPAPIKQGRSSCWLKSETKKWIV
ncbi:Transcriptional regulator, AlpA [Salmonella enterica]|uniref:Transcriptional regulator, AlpA n=1 Tax=Salmonella enterica TaxID=28901 RepID=A0A7D8EW77_SALER|nr:Transcriptional regulator, AlpA [Salmonella enterica]